MAQLFLLIIDYWILWLIILAGVLLSIQFKKLTPAAALTGGLVSVFIFAGAGYTGIWMMAAFFILSVLVTAWKLETKQRNGLAETDKGRRTAGQVLANAGAPALLGLLLHAHYLQPGIVHAMIAACFASAMADTVSSELGNIYGSKFYNILTLRKDQRGLNGVVSLEGTLFGLAGSTLIALIYVAGFGWSRQLIIIIVAGTAGNLMDSILGGTLERKNYLNNNTVNFLNTCFAAVVACIGYNFL
jgi:uncharacterized protein (TIGR00297 family)